MLENRPYFRDFWITAVEHSQLCHEISQAWWRHQMETFSMLLAICAGNSPVPGEFPTQRPVTRSFDVFFDLARINGWVNNDEAGDSRRHRAHYGVIVIFSRSLWVTCLNNKIFDDRKKLVILCGMYKKCLTLCILEHGIDQFRLLYESRAVPLTHFYQNTLRPRQKGHRFADVVFKCIFLNG